MGGPLEILGSPWMDTFKELIGRTTSNFTFTSPFVKAPAVKTVMDSRMHDFSISGIVSFRLRNFERHASDMEAIKLLHRSGAIVKNIPNIHSKVYIFDTSAAVISSANLTPGGLIGNVEMGVLLKDQVLVRKVKGYVDGLFRDADTCFNVTLEVVEESERILESLPAVSTQRGPDLDDMEKALFRAEEVDEDKVFKGGSSAILTGLSGWTKDVFACLLRIEADTFKLDQVYSFEGDLSRLYPENTFVKDQIRKQLQKLRDIGLLEFTSGKGDYRKLWS
jgi:hypothetical protein